METQFVDDVETMSNDRLDIEDFMSSSVVKSTETFDAASTGILDGDMTGAAYQTGKDPAFQFLGDVMGGYGTPDQMCAWLEFGGGGEIADEIHPLPFPTNHGMVGREGERRRPASGGLRDLPIVQ